MSEELKALMESLGAIAEMSKIQYDEFKKVRFTEPQAMYLVGKMISALITNASNREEPN